MTKTLLRGGRIIDPSRDIDKTADIQICEGIITQISDSPIDESCDVLIDCDGLVATTTARGNCPQLYKRLLKLGGQICQLGENKLDFFVSLEML